MAGPNRPARLNRTLLLLVGLVLLAGGVFVLATAFGLLPLFDPASPAVAAPPRLPGWSAWVAAAIAVVVGLFCLRWLLAQTIRRARTHRWQLAADPRQGETHLAADTAAAPLVAEIETYPGVHRASARLAGPRARPSLHLVVATEDRADVTDLRHRIDTDALPRLREALELERLDADLLLRLDDARSPRTL